MRQQQGLREKAGAAGGSAPPPAQLRRRRAGRAAGAAAADDGVDDEREWGAGPAAAAALRGARLAAVLAAVPLKQRATVCAAVCRRWRAACWLPEPAPAPAAKAAASPAPAGGAIAPCGVGGELDLSYTRCGRDARGGRRRFLRALCFAAAHNAPGGYPLGRGILDDA